MTDRGCASPDHPSLAARVLVRRATRNAHPFLCADVVRSARRELSAAAICSCRLWPERTLATRRAHLLRPCDGQRDPDALDWSPWCCRVSRTCRAVCGISCAVRGIHEHCHFALERGRVVHGCGPYPLDMSLPLWWSNASYRHSTRAVPRHSLETRDSESRTHSTADRPERERGRAAARAAPPGATAHTR